MWGQSLLLRASNIVSNSRAILNNRIYPVVLPPQPVCGLRSSQASQLKEMNIPEKPKRPLSAYFRFAAQQREQIKKQYPDIKITEMSKKCAEKWRTVDQTLKMQLEQEYQSEMVEYGRKIAEYASKLSPEQKDFLKSVQTKQRDGKKKREMRQQLKDANKPKRPLGSYMLFLMEESKTSNKKLPELMVELKSKWANMSPVEKTKYTQTAAQSQKEYEKELMAWEIQMLQEGKDSLVRAKTLAERRPASMRKRQKTEQAPKKRGE